MRPFSRKFGKSVGALPVAALLVWVAILSAQNSSMAFELPLLLAWLNTIFLGAIPLGVAYLAARSYQATGVFAFLLTGCGLVFFGVSSLYAGWVMPLAGGPNPTVTVHNLGSLLAGACQLVGAHFFLQEVVSISASKPRAQRYEIFYALIVALVSATAVLAFQGQLPVFFDPLTGPSFLRQLVLGSAMGLFAVAGLMFVEIYAVTKTVFAYWYGLALGLIAVGLACVYLQPNVGSMLGWTGRGAQYLGSLYIILACWQGRQEVAAAAKSTRRLWPYLEQKIGERTVALTRLNEALRKEITERQQTETALHESETRFRTFVDAIEDIVYTLDGQQRHTGVFGRWVEKTGLSPDVFLGKTSREVLGEEAALAHEAANQRALAGEFTIYDWSVPGTDGARHYQTSLSPIYDHAGVVTGLVGIGRDITARKQAEEALRESEASLKFSQQVAHVGHWTWDTVANRVTWSDEMYRIFGLEPATFDGDLDKVIMQAIHPDDREKVINSNNAVLTEQKPAPLEYRVVWPDQSVHTIWAEAGGKVFDAHGKILKLSGIVQDITARQQAEEALRAGEEAYRTLVEGLPDIVMRFERDGRHLFVSDNVKEAVGLRAAQFIGKTHRELDFPEAQCRFWEEAIRAVFDSGTAYETEFSFAGKQGPVIYNWRLAPELDTQGRVRSVLSISRDITAHKQTEESLRESEEKFRRLVELSVDGIVLIDEQGRITEWNQGQEHITGLKCAEVIGRPLWEVQVDLALPEQNTPARRKQVKASIENFLRTGDAPWQNQLIEIEFQAAEGVRRFMQSITFPIRTTKGVMAASIARDITEGKRMEESLRQNETRYHELFENINSGVAVYEVKDDGRDFIFKDFNRAGEKIDHDRRERLLGQSIFEVRPSIEQFGLLEVFRQVWQTGQPAYHPITMYQDEHLTAWYENFVYKLPSGEIVAVFENVTERKQAEEQIKASLREKEVMLQEIHHRVKNNLQVISSLLDLQADTVQDPATLQILRDSQNRVRSMAMVHEKLYHSENLAQVDMADYIQEMVDYLFMVYDDQSRPVVSRLAVAGVFLGIDQAVPCGLIINELVSNALKYAFPEERNERREGRPPEIRVEFEVHEGEYVLVVSDNGVGLPPELDIDETPSLGLRLVKILTGQLRGALAIDSHQGATLKLTFPENHQKSSAGHIFNAPPGERKS